MLSALHMYYPIETYLKKPTAGKPVSYARICLKSQFHCKKIDIDDEARFGYKEDYCSC